MEICFTDVIRPLTVEVFLRDYWEREPFVGQSNRACTELIRLSEIEYLFSSLPNPGQDLLSLSKEGRLLPATAYVRHDGLVSVQSVCDAFESGHTIVLRKLERRWLPLQRLARSIEQQLVTEGVMLSRNVEACVHLTPVSGVGPVSRVDTGSTLVLQLAGEERWRVYDPHAAGAANRQPAQLTELAASHVDRILRPGDVLFVPRGWYYQGAAGTMGSLRVSFDIQPSTWYDVLNAALEEEPLTRRGLPPGLGQGSDEAVATNVFQREIAERIASASTLQRAAQGLTSKFIESLAVLPGGGLETILEPSPMTEQTRLVRRHGAIPWVSVNTDRVRLCFPGSALSGPQAAHPLFLFLEERSSFTVAELPGALTSAEKVALASQLVRERLLAVANTKVNQ